MPTMSAPTDRTDTTIVNGSAALDFSILFRLPRVPGPPQRRKREPVVRRGFCVHRATFVLRYRGSLSHLWSPPTGLRRSAGVLWDGVYRFRAKTVVERNHAGRRFPR